jgi:hypothetical protein
MNVVARTPTSKRRRNFNDDNINITLRRIYFSRYQIGQTETIPIPRTSVVEILAEGIVEGMW